MKGQLAYLCFLYLFLGLKVYSIAPNDLDTKERKGNIHQRHESVKILRTFRSSMSKIEIRERFFREGKRD